MDTRKPAKPRLRRVVAYRFVGTVEGPMVSYVEYWFDDGTAGFGRPDVPRMAYRSLPSTVTPWLSPGPWNVCDWKVAVYDEPL
jgi:hypothetical protein